MTKYISNISVKDATKILIDNDLQDTQVSDYEASIKAMYTGLVAKRGINALLDIGNTI